MGKNDVHLWRARLDRTASDIAHLRNALTSEELARAERFSLLRNRSEYIAGRGLLRTILSRYVPAKADQIRFTYNEHGKPVLAYPGGDDAVSFNLSHSSGLALFAVTQPGRLVGVDLERLRPRISHDRIARKFFSSQEYVNFSAMTEPMKIRAFLRFWTRLEAYSKASGEGVTFASPAPLNGPETAPLGFSMRSVRTLIPAFGYVAALAVEDRDWHLTGWQWTDDGNGSG